MNWVEQANNLLHGNESIRERVRVGEGGVVVTNHRVLAFTPDSDGSNYETVDRPNVEDIDIQQTGDIGYLVQGAKAAFLGITLIAFGYFFSLDQLAEDISLETGGAASAVGVGGMLEMAQTIIEWLALLDDLLLGAGVLSLAFSVVVFGLYVHSRKRRLTISVAGADDVRLAVPEDETVPERLRASVGISESGPSTNPVSTPTPSATSGSEDPLEDSVEAPDSGEDWSSSDEPDSEPATADASTLGTIIEPSDDESEGEPVESSSDGRVDIPEPDDGS